MEVKRRSKQSTLTNNNGLTLPHHHVVHVNNVMSCHLMGSHMPHLVFNDVHMFQKCIVKGKSKEHAWNTKSHVKLKSHRKSNNHEGSQRVTRKRKHHPLVMYTPSLYEKRNFHLGYSQKALER